MQVHVGGGVGPPLNPGVGRAGGMRRPGRTRTTRWFFAILAVVGVVLVVVGATLAARNWMHGAAWTGYDAALVTVRLIGAVLGLGVGLWWWWRAPANPTGRLLYVAAAADVLLVVGYCWPGSRWADELTWVSWLTEPLIVIIVLSWPSGHPSRRLVRTVTWWTVAGAALVLVGDVFSRRPNAPTDWPDPFEALFTVPTVFRIVDPIQALATQALPAAVVLVVLVRRRRAVPPAVRPLLTPITTAGVVVCGSLLILHLGFQVFGYLLGYGATLTIWRFLIFLGYYFMVGFVALGVLVGARRRRRAVSMGRRHREVDLQSAKAVITPSAAAAATTGDPTTLVRYRRLDGSWIDAAGTTLPEATTGRRLIPVLDEVGATTAALEVAESTPLSPLLTDLAISIIAAQSANERATAVADARRAEVRMRSRELVAATDSGRRRLERDLHDGAQQLLVGLALMAGLSARRGELDTQGLIDHIGEVRREILALVDQATPAALAEGLAGALHALATVCPIPVFVDAEGDLTADDPLALTLYLAAGEAITNAVKHSGARLICVRLGVVAVGIDIRVSDDGIGSLAEVPPSIASRLVDVGGSASVASPPLGGTVLHMYVHRPTVSAAALT
ncbi:MAG: histidine kinase [Actinomycetota bacterium]|nr:histidine kinase [Actinomycetota bacterium]